MHKSLKTCPRENVFQTRDTSSLLSQYLKIQFLIKNPFTLLASLILGKSRGTQYWPVKGSPDFAGAFWEMFSFIKKGDKVLPYCP